MFEAAVEDGDALAVPEVDWDTLGNIAQLHGSSFYLADVNRFERNCRRFLDAFQSHYSRTSFGYSYKTNYLPAFIQRADALGALAEVVSRFEFDLARELGIPGERIIFNGPVKNEEDLRQAFAAGAMLNADSLSELLEIIKLADEFTRPTPVGIRCYLGVNETPHSRFGIDLRTQEAAEALAALDAAPNLRLAGLHCHHSGDRGAKRYADRTAAMIKLHASVLGGRPLDYLDIGGGFGSAMSAGLAAQMPSPAASAADYGDAVAGQMQAVYGDDGPELIIEPGMGVLADTMVFITRVETIKRLEDRHLAVVDGSIFNVKPLRGSINLPIRVVAAADNAPRDNGRWDVVGHTCMEVDLLHTGYEGRIGIGDFVLVENVGAYTNVLNAPFIRGTPPILEMTSDGSCRVLRRGSTASDLAHSYAP